MTRTTYEQAMDEALAEAIAVDPNLKATIFDAQQNLKGDFWPYADWFGQNHLDSYSARDAFAFLCINSALMNGEVYGCEVAIGSDPMRDSDREENQARLSRAHKAFRFEVNRMQSTAMCDGFVHITEPIVVSALNGDAKATRTIPAETEILLEIGTTSFTSSWWHLFEDGSLARWPYGSHSVYLFFQASKFGGAA